MRWMAAAVAAAIACGGSQPAPPPPAAPPPTSVAREAFQAPDAWYFVERFDDGTARAVRVRGTEVSEVEPAAIEGTPRLQQDGPIAARSPQLVPPDPARGFHWPYLLYIPEAPTSPHLFVVPTNTGEGNDEFGFHYDATLQRAGRNAELAERLGLIMLAPVFPRPRTQWQIYTHALDRDTLAATPPLGRLDAQLVAMIDDARARLAPRELDARVVIGGFSASGMFANRFALLHPDRVAAWAAGSPGGWPVAPHAQWNGAALRWPIGVADVAELTGTPPDLAAFAALPCFVFLGDQDDNDSVPFGDGYDPQDKELVFATFGDTPVTRWPRAVELYEAAGVTCSFRLYPGVGHTMSPDMVRDLLAFFATHAR